MWIQEVAPAVATVAQTRSPLGGCVLRNPADPVVCSEMQGSGYPHEYFPGVSRGLGQGLTVWTPYPSRVTQGYCDTPGYNVTIIK
jgi:hypothetical protein